MDAKGENDGQVPDVNDGMNENPTYKDGSDTENVDEVRISGTLPKSEESSCGKESNAINSDWSSECESSHGWNEAAEKYQKELHAQLKRHRLELIEILKQHVNLNKSLENQVQLRHEIYGQITTSNPVTSTSSSTQDIDGFTFHSSEKFENFEGVTNTKPAAIRLATQPWDSNLPGSSKAPHDLQTVPNLPTPMSSPIRKTLDEDCMTSENSSAVTESHQPQRTISPETFDDHWNKNINLDTKPIVLPDLPFEDFVKEDRYSGDKGKRPLNPKYAYKKGSKPVPKSDPENTDAEALAGEARKSPIKIDGSSGELHLINVNLHSAPSVQNTPTVISTSNLKMEDQERGTDDTAQQIIDSAERAVISTDTKPISIVKGTRSLEDDVLTSPKKRHKSYSPEITSSRKKQKSDRDSGQNGSLHSNLRESATCEGAKSNKPQTVELLQKKNKECLIQ